MKKIYVFTLICVIIALISACKNQAQKDESNSNKEQKGAPATRQQISQSAYFGAALNGDYPTVKKAVESGMEVDATNENGSTPLMLAAFNGHKKIVEFLLQEGAKVNKTDSFSRNALIYAASGSNSETVQVLIEAGAQLDHTDQAEGFTAIMFAASEGQTEVVKILLEAGADPSIKDKDGDAALDFARNNGHQQIVDILNKN